MTACFQRSRWWVDIKKALHDYVRVSDRPCLLWRLLSPSWATRAEPLDLGLKSCRMQRAEQHCTISIVDLLSVPTLFLH